jgi:hypothetical protein
MNLIGKFLILITIIGTLSFGLVAFVNNRSASTGFSQDESSQRFQPDQSGSTSHSVSIQRSGHNGGFEGDGERGTVSFVEIGKSLGVFSLITLIVVLMQKGFTKIFHRKPTVNGY